LVTTETKQRILVVDDAPEIRELLTDFLNHKYDVLTAKSGKEALHMLYTADPNLVISDVSMPEMDGWLFLDRLREAEMNVPVIMLSALGESRDKVRGLNGGADDYLVKPISRDELLARIEAVLRRVTREPQPKALVEDKADVYQDDLLYVDFNRYVVRVRGKEKRFSKTELSLLTVLVRNAGFVLSTDRLLDLAWGVSEGGTADNVRMYISYLREKIGRDAIENVRGIGYRYVRQRQMERVA
jgi:two-component system OmpR family response regulator